MLVIIIALLVVIIAIMLVGSQAVLSLLTSGCGCVVAFGLLIAAYLAFVSFFGQDVAIFTTLAIGLGVALFALAFGKDGSSNLKRSDVPWWQLDQGEDPPQRFHSRAPSKEERKRIRDQLRDRDDGFR